MIPADVMREGERKRTVAEVSKLSGDVETRGTPKPWDKFGG
jgi:hypothetical protein